MLEARAGKLSGFPSMLMPKSLSAALVLNWAMSYEAIRKFVAAKRALALASI
jgi:hypothetical protein